MLMLAGLVAGCSSSSTPRAPTTTATAPSSTTPSIASSPSPPALNPAPARSSLNSCPPPQPEKALSIVARLQGAPDDLASTGDGVWVSDENNGRISKLGSDGSLGSVLADPRGPEGIIPLDDGRLIVAEQRADRVVVMRPPSAAVISTVAQLQPVPGRDGIDSIALDAPRQRLLLPDSAQGALRVVAVDGGAITTLATGLGRVVAATVGPDGGIYVAAEGTPGLWRVPASGGSATPVGNLHDLDEVVTAGHLLYVTELADGTVRALDPASGDSRVLATGIGSPQGLAVLRDGRLAVTDSNRGLVLALQPC